MLVLVVIYKMWGLVKIILHVFPLIGQDDLFVIALLEYMIGIHDVNTM